MKHLIDVGSSQVGDGTLDDNVEVIDERPLGKKGTKEWEIKRSLEKVKILNLIKP